MIELVEVDSARRARQFLDAPYDFHRGTPWVPPLRLQLRLMMGSLKTPEKRFYLAFDGDRVVGRIGAQVHKGERLHFGFFECHKDYPEAARLLVEKAHEVAPKLSMRGPFQFRMEDAYTGILIKGFDIDPYFMVSYNPEYYLPFLEDAGLEKVVEMNTYELPWDRLEGRFAGRGKRPPEGLSVRGLRRRNWIKDIITVTKTLDRALANNWGFEPVDKWDILQMIVLGYLILDPKDIHLAELDGQAVGALCLIPNYNPLIKRSQGRLTLGLLRDYLNRFETVKSIRGWALGLTPEARKLGFGVARELLRETVAYLKAREPAIELSWILANNTSMNKVARALGGSEPNKVHCILEKGPVA